MKHLLWVVASATAALAWQGVYAQSNDERRAAAERLLQRESLKIKYSGSNYSSTYSLDLKAKTVMLYGSPDRFCAARPVPATWRVLEDGTISFLFDPQKPGCAQLQYNFDPISLNGQIRYREPPFSEGQAWVESKSKISLQE